MGIASIISGLAKPVTDIISKAVKDKDLAAQLNQQVTLALMEHGTRELEAKRDVLVAEVKGEGLKAQWRPLTMLTFVAIVANNYIIAPYIGLFFGPEYRMVLDMPEQLWSLLQIGLGGYILGRSGEAISRNVAMGRH